MNISEETLFTVLCNLQGRVPRHWAKRPEDSYYQRRVIMPWVAIVGPHFTWTTAGTAEMKTRHFYLAFCFRDAPELCRRKEFKKSEFGSVTPPSSQTNI